MNEMKKHNDLIHTLRRRKDEYKPLLPGDGWERLEAELASRSVHRRVQHRWVAAAVALLCAVLSLPWFLKKEMTEMEKIDSRITDTRPVVPETTDEHQATEAKEAFGQTVQKTSRLTAKQIAIGKVLSEDNVVPDRTETNVDQNTSDEHPEVTPFDNRRQPAKQADMGPQPETNPLTRLPNGKDMKKQRQARHRWSAGVQAGSNAMVGAGESNLVDLTSIPDTDYTNPDNPDNPDGQEVPTKAIPSPPGRNDGDAYHYDHKIQLSTGFMLRRQLSDRFAVETGLLYSYLYSDIWKESTGKKAGNQKVHYLGIPLRINWTFYRQGRFATYLSVGVAAEYCLSARIHLDDVSYSPDIDRWEWSLNTAAGLQYTLAEPVSLFLEPGVSYYFDRNERNAFETIRTSNPLTFSLQLGVRFSY